MQPEDRLALDGSVARLEMEFRSERSSNYIVWAVEALIPIVAALGYPHLDLPADARPFFVAAVLVYLLVIVAKSVREWRVAQTWSAQLDATRALIGSERVHVVRCEATAVAMIEAADDERAVFAFQVDPSRLFLVSSVQLEDLEGFPSTSFEILQAGRETRENYGVLVDGEPLEPARVIPASVRDRLRVIVDQEELAGSLADLEQLLALAPKT